MRSRRLADPNAPACRVALLDIGPDRSGFEVAEQLAGETRVVLISSRGTRTSAARPRERRAGFISKEDLSGEALLALLEAA